MEDLPRSKRKALRNSKHGNRTVMSQSAVCSKDLTRMQVLMTVIILMSWDYLKSKRIRDLSRLTKSYRRKKRLNRHRLRVS